MPYRHVLEKLLQALSGAQAALLLDPQGELVVEAGSRDERHRLVGAYQGIGLAMARRTSARYAAGQVRHIVCRYHWGSVILCPLKDGYYFVVSLGPEALVAQGVQLAEETQAQINAEL